MGGVIERSCISCKYMEGSLASASNKPVCMHEDVQVDVKDYVAGTWTVLHPSCKDMRASEACGPEGRLYRGRKE